MEDEHNKQWVPCPLCGRYTKTKVCFETVVIHFPLYCSHCKKETMVDIMQFKMVLSKKPDA